MEALEMTQSALANLLTLQNILLIIVGIVGGLVVGSLPGFNDANFLAIILPFVVYLPTDAALVFMSALYCGAQSAGAIPAILINIPGTPGTSASLLEGYPLTKKGKSGLALGTSYLSSGVGGIIGGLIVLFFAPIVGDFAMLFRSPEMFLLAILGMSIVGSLTAGAPLKGLVAAIFGLLLGAIGTDPQTGFIRAGYGFPELFDGVPLIPALLGLFGVAELISLTVTSYIGSGSDTGGKGEEATSSISEAYQGMKAAFKYKINLIRSSIIGTFIGAVPGAGATVAQFLAYGQARQWSKNKEDFGNGSVEGLSASDSANNATTAGALIPTLAFGIPGSATTMVMLSVLLVQGVTPGPDFYVDYGVETYTVFLSVIFASAIILVVGLPLSSLMIRVVNLPTKTLLPFITVLCLIGGYAWRFYMFDIALMLALGIVGYILKQNKYPVPAFLLGLILGPIAEINLYRSLRLEGIGIFLESNVSIALLVFTVVVVLYSLYSSLISKSKVQS